MRGSTPIPVWFAEHPEALEAVRGFLDRRVAGERESVRSLLAALKDEHSFPYASEPSLIRFMQSLNGGEMPKASARAADETGVRWPAIKALPERLKAIRGARKWVITAAQNNTPVSELFLQSLLRFCVHEGAELIVRPLRARIPGQDLDPWWHGSIREYLFDDEIEFKDWILPDIRLSLTVANPLSGLDARSGAKHAVYAATQLQMRSVATPQNQAAKILYSTGAVTESNYPATKSGNLADFHHSLSATLVETDGKRTWIRGLVFDGKWFADVDRYYPARAAVRKAMRWAALVPGDEHALVNDPAVEKATYGPGGLTERGDPHRIVRHDLLDSYSVSHHHNANQITKTLKNTHELGNLRDELDLTIDFLKRTSTRRSTNLHVSSNHGDHLTQWLAFCGDRNVTDENRLLYHELMAGVLRSAKKTATGVSYQEPFEAYCQGKLGRDCLTEWLGSTDAYIVKDVDLALHGHRGTNGSRGSARGLSSIGAKVIIGHSHSPQIVKGCYQTGTSTLMNLEYLSGPSSWVQAHCILHDSGRRQIIHMVGGDFHAPRT
jgi:hypothetical protein